MNFIEGQGIFGRVKFKDGTYPLYDRPYLIIKVEKDYVEVLNVSSVKGKERKLAFPTNEKLLKYCPPFLKPSFVKLDSLTCLPKSEWNKFTILSNGLTLDKTELNRILQLIQ